MEIYFFHTDIQDGEKLNIVRGKRNVIVRENGKFYKLHLYSPERIISLLEDYQNSDSSQPLILMDSSMILPSIDQESIVKQLLSLGKRNYFQNKNAQSCYDLNTSFPEKITEHGAILKYRDKYYMLTIALNEKISAVPQILMDDEEDLDNIKSRFLGIIHEGRLEDIPYTKYTYLISLLKSIYCEG